VIDTIDTGRRGGFDPEVVDATTFPITIEDEASTGERTMRAWSSDALPTMAVTDDLHIAPCRGDGKTYGTPPWMWYVAVEALVMCARPTASTLTGVRPHCGKRRGGSLPLG
jgi:hypothetical protein